MQTVPANPATDLANAHRRTRHALVAVVAITVLIVLALARWGESWQTWTLALLLAAAVVVHAVAQSDVDVLEHQAGGETGAQPAASVSPPPRRPVPLRLRRALMDFLADERPDVRGTAL